MNKRSSLIKKTKRCVIKIGSALLTQNGKGLDIPAIKDWVKQLATIKNSNVEIILVSSGSVAEGMSRMGWEVRPKALHELQAAAAIGQAGLIQTYQQSFEIHQFQTAQILLTHDDFSNRQRYLNARSTLHTLLKLGAIPIVNENDTVALEEIRLGDNDTLAAMVANLIDADLLIILTDQAGLYDKDPRESSDAKLISLDSANNPELLDFAGSAGTAVGTGGMRTKVLAARSAARSGCTTIIAPGAEKNVLTRIMEGENLGTLLTADCEPLTARKQWISHQTNVTGELTIDTGAEKAIQEKGRSLLSVGVTHVTGQFERGDVVSCINSQGAIIARGVTNYSYSECLKILGLSSHNIEEALGYVDEAELIHRNNLVIH
ncbi:MAG: glutamate 5-kinase [Thiotrichaceae bacterium]